MPVSVYLNKRTRELEEDLLERFDTMGTQKFVMSVAQQLKRPYRTPSKACEVFYVGVVPSIARAAAAGRARTARSGTGTRAREQISE
eukprot:scaffold210638_cov29-Tisochrysis_lutea.AAC.1